MAKTNTILEITTHDGQTHTVQTTLEDRLAFEQALRKNKSWGKLEDNTLKMQPFMGWHALKRTGKTELSWAEFTTGDTAALDVSVPAPDEDDADDDALEVEGVGKDTPTAPSNTSPLYSPEITGAHRGNGVASPALD